MPNMVWTSEGLVIILEVALVDTTTFEQTDWWLDLYVNDVTPTYFSILSDFTLATFTGYSRVSITREDFIGTEVDYAHEDAHTKRIMVPTFTCTGGTPQTAYGWVMHGKDSTELYVAQKFAAGRVMSTGAVIQLDPFNVKLRSIP